MLSPFPLAPTRWGSFRTHFAPCFPATAAPTCSDSSLTTRGLAPRTTARLHASTGYISSLVSNFLTLHCLTKSNESWVIFHYNTMQLLPKTTLGKTWCVEHSGSPPVQPSQHPTNGITSTPHFVCARNASTPTGAWCPTKAATSSLVYLLAAQRRALALAHSRSLAR